MKKSEYTNSSQLVALLDLIIEQKTGTAINRTMSQAAITKELDSIKEGLAQKLNYSFYNDPKIQILLNDAAEGKKLLIDTLNEYGFDLEYDTPYIQIKQALIEHTDAAQSTIEELNLRIAQLEDELDAAKGYTLN